MAGAIYGFGTNNSFGTFLLVLPNKSSPIQTIAFGTNWSSVACGLNHTAAIKTGGTLWTWGRNSYGQLGNNTRLDYDSPIQTIAYGTNWSQVACGQNHTAAIKTDGTLWTWGTNFDGQLGDNTVTHKSSPVQTITGGTNWASVACGGFHTAAVKTDGTLWCWGSNAYGRLGDGTTVGKSSPIQTIAYGTNWSSVSAGDRHTAAIKNDGTLWVWGYNYFGQIGDNTGKIPPFSSDSKSSPVQTITFATNWSSVACGFNHTAAIKTDGTLWVWGRNSEGQIGEDTRIHRSSPVQTIAYGTNWSKIYGGPSTSSNVAIKTDGTLWVWGGNSGGQLGDNTISSKSSPVQTIAFGTNWTYAGSGLSHLSAVKTDGTLWISGSNSYGKLGDLSVFRFSPAIITSTNNWLSFAKTAYNHAAAIKTDGTLWTWGQNSYGQLGNNTIVHNNSPDQTSSGGTNWISVACGYGHTAAIKTDGTLWCWGQNSGGQLGDNTRLNRSSPVQTIAGGTNWSKVACGQFYTAAIKTDGTLWCWGQNSSGQLGDNTRLNRSSPVQTANFGNNWSSVACSSLHTAAIKTDGTLWCWGLNSTGLLGDNTNISKSSPVQTIAFGTNWSSVACGFTHTAAIKTDGTLWAWGRNSYGQLGDNTTTNKSSPIQTIAYGTNWSSVLGGTNYTVGKKKNGSLWTWGNNPSGQLGDNTVTRRSSPVQTADFGTNWTDFATTITSPYFTFVIYENSPNQLGINTQPLAGYNSNQLLVQPKININDSAGSLVRIATNSVTVAVQSGTATLSGTTTVTAVDGVATFTDLVLTGSGAVTLRFTSSGLTLVDSSSFTVSLTLPIIPKRSEVSDRIPTSGQLNIGELAINIDDRRGYVKKSDGTILNIFNGEIADGGTF